MGALRAVNMTFIVTDEHRILMDVSAQEPNQEGEIEVIPIMKLSWNGCQHYMTRTRGEFVMQAAQQMLSIIQGHFLEVQCPEVANPDLDIKVLWEEETGAVH
jgi:hypothetical protein